MEETTYSSYIVDARIFTNGYQPPKVFPCCYFLLYSRRIHKEFFLLKPWIIFRPSCHAKIRKLMVRISANSAKIA